MGSASYKIKEIEGMSNADLLSEYRRWCEKLMAEANIRARGETKRTVTNVERLEAELKKRLNISD